MPKWKGKQNQLRVYGILCAWSIAVLVTIRIEVVCSVYFYVIAVQPLAVAATVCELRHYIFKYLDISFITKFETGETSPFHLCAQGELLRDANNNHIAVVLFLLIRSVYKPKLLSMFSNDVSSSTFHLLLLLKSFKRNEIIDTGFFGLKNRTFHVFISNSNGVSPFVLYFNDYSFICGC